MEVYVLLTDTGTWFTKLIKLFTQKPLNHASISFDKELNTVYSFGRKNPNNPFIGGFVKEDMRGILFNEANCAIYRFTITDKQFVQMNEYIFTIKRDKEKYRYNFLGLFAVLVNKEWNRENAFFCSEFVATILKEAGISIKNKPVSLVRPYDLIEYEGFDLVYEGPLRMYIEKEKGLFISYPLMNLTK